MKHADGHLPPARLFSLLANTAQ